ncbi:MAG: molybdate ABC transporter permease subunit [Corynebacterium sp.]|nr:molybdate ABC transporter permease subunit [Corynebacterium sp.]
MSQPTNGFPPDQPPLARPVHIPGVLMVLAALGCAFLLFPLAALATRVSWGTLGATLSDPTVQVLLDVTLHSALYATIITVLLGVPMAIMLQRLRRGAQLARVLILLPLAMPPVVAGLALTALLGRRGLSAPLLNALDWKFAFAFSGVVVSHIFIALPFVVITVDAALRQIDREVFDSAAGVGLSPWQVLWRITLPTLRPAIVTGTGLAFVRSLGEFGTTLTFAGSLPGRTRTMPIGIYLARETNPVDAYNLAAILILLALFVLLLTSIFAFRRTPLPVARVSTDLDTDALQRLCTPQAAAPKVRINDIEFPAGQVTALVGPNGSGKTTLLGQIGGRLGGGRVQVADRDISNLAPHRRGIVVVTQKPGLPPFATVAQTMTMVTGSKTTTAELLAAAGLQDLAGVRCDALSGGQAAQVALVRGLAARPTVLLLDEPLAAVDNEASWRWRALLRVAAHGRTTVLVSHDPLEVASISTSVAVLKRGTVIAHADTTALFQIPPNAFVAKFTGRNRLPGVVRSVDREMVVLELPAAQGSEPITITGVNNDGALVQMGNPVVAVVEPLALTLQVPGDRAGSTDSSGVSAVPAVPAVPVESARNHWPGRISSIEAQYNSGVSTNVMVTVAGVSVLCLVTAQSVRDLGLEIGSEVVISAKALNVLVFQQL